MESIEKQVKQEIVVTRPTQCYLCLTIFRHEKQVLKPKATFHNLLLSPQPCQLCLSLEADMKVPFSDNNVQSVLTVFYKVVHPNVVFVD